MTVMTLHDDPTNMSRSTEERRDWYAKWGKRGFDLIVGSLMLIVLAPVIVVAAMVVAIRLGRPVFFRQRRPGLHGKPFEMIKFRSMTDECDATGALLPDDQRLTAFGQVPSRQQCG